VWRGGVDEGDAMSRKGGSCGKAGAGNLPERIRNLGGEGAIVSL